MSIPGTRDFHHGLLAGISKIFSSWHTCPFQKLVRANSEVFGRCLRHSLLIRQPI